MTRVRYRGIVKSRVWRLRAFVRTSKLKVAILPLKSITRARDAVESGTRRSATLLLVHNNLDAISGAQSMRY